MSDKLEALKAAAEKYSITLKAHQENPKDFDALVAWDTATSEITSLINNDEISIITSLLAALEEKDQAHRVHAARLINERGQLRERAEAAEHRLALVRKQRDDKLIINAELEQRLQQPIRLPAGFRIVPIKPTREQLEAVNVAGKSVVYTDMVLAAPEHPGFKVEGE